MLLPPLALPPCALPLPTGVTGLCLGGAAERQLLLIACGGDAPGFDAPPFVSAALLGERLLIGGGALAASGRSLTGDALLDAPIFCAAKNAAPPPPPHERQTSVGRADLADGSWKNVGHDTKAWGQHGVC